MKYLNASLVPTHWPLPDPKGQGIESVRQTRDEIKRRVLQFLEQERLLNGLS